MKTDRINKYPNNILGKVKKKICNIWRRREDEPILTENFSVRDGTGGLSKY